MQMRLSDRTERMITRRDFDLRKPTAYFISTSRGGLVVEEDLIAALREKRIAGAGLDVFAVEPLPLDNPRRSMGNTLLTAHLGYSTPPESMSISPSSSRTSVPGGRASRFAS